MTSGTRNGLSVQVIRLIAYGCVFSWTSTRAFQMHLADCRSCRPVTSTFFCDLCDSNLQQYLLYIFQFLFAPVKRVPCTSLQMHWVPERPGTQNDLAIYSGIAEANKSGEDILVCFDMLLHIDVTYRSRNQANLCYNIFSFLCILLLYGPNGASRRYNYGLNCSSSPKLWWQFFISTSSTNIRVAVKAHKV